MNNKASQGPRTPLNWSTAHEVTGNANLVVQINKTDEPRPRFSIKIGRKTAEGHIAPFLPVYLDGIKVRSAKDEIAKLIAEAEMFIESAVIDARAVADAEQANAGKPQTRHTGKTERKRNKHNTQSQD